MDSYAAGAGTLVGSAVLAHGVERTTSDTYIHCLLMYDTQRLADADGRHKFVIRYYFPQVPPVHNVAKHSLKLVISVGGFLVSKPLAELVDGYAFHSVVLFC